LDPGSVEASFVNAISARFNRLIKRIFTSPTTVHKIKTNIIACLDYSTHEFCRGADKSLVRPGRKQANVSVRIA